MHIEDKHDLPINDYLWDDTLLKVLAAYPRYANIVNYMVSGYVPLGVDKKKLIKESQVHLWDNPYLYRVCQDGVLRRCVRKKNPSKSLRSATELNMEAIMIHLGPMPKFGKVDSIGLPCTKTIKTSSRGLGGVSNMGISIPVLSCFLQKTFKWICFMSGV